jgi:hypothetical protein
MDVNGTRFHLFRGESDWRRCTESGSGNGWADLAWDDRAGALTLRPLLSIFPRGRRDVPLAAEARRGAAVDRFGNIYWISQDQQRVYWQPTGDVRPSVYWQQPAEPSQASSGEFGPARPHPGTLPGGEGSGALAGLVVTGHHYLVVGDAAGRGLLIFDLHAGGQPSRLEFPESVPFEPFDMAAAPDDGFWVLDRVNRAYWGFDRGFRVVSEPALLEVLEPAELATFRPVGGSAVLRPGRQFPHGFPLDADDPIAIEGLPDGTVLILDSPADAAVSLLWHLELSAVLAGPLPLEEALGNEETVGLAAHDLAFDAASGLLYTVQRDGNQAMAWLLRLGDSPPDLELQATYLPMHYFGGRALLAASDRLLYDVAPAGALPLGADLDAAARWAALVAVDEPKYARDAILETPVLDGKTRNCAWHRVLLDACLPASAEVRVWTRAHNDLDLLATVSYAPEPALVLRRDNGELPFYRPALLYKAAATGQDVQTLDDTGVWELLVQQTQGRYAQVRLELAGNGRVTPMIETLRVYYPRFSYPERYLPAIYRDPADADAASFLERLLANTEGFYSEIEGRMRDVSMLFDARSAPGEALDWLAGWYGLLVDPLWAGIQARRVGGGVGYGGSRYGADAYSTDRAYYHPRYDRRRLFIRYARKLYQRRGTLDGIRFALLLLLDPCLEILLERFKQAAVNPAHALHRELGRLAMPHPTPSTGEQALEDMLYDYVLVQPSQVRIIERFMTRGGRDLVAGDPTATGGERSFEADAHRFSVLTPQGMSAEEEAMVSRIINLEKPAHTQFEVRRFWDAFRIGEIRLGMDTVVGPESRFAPIIVGQHHLADGYLVPHHPMDVPERFVSDRDPLR